MFDECIEVILNRTDENRGECTRHKSQFMGERRVGSKRGFCRRTCFVMYQTHARNYKICHPGQNKIFHPFPPK